MTKRWLFLVSCSTVTCTAGIQGGCFWHCFALVFARGKLGKSQSLCSASEADLPCRCILRLRLKSAKLQVIVKSSGCCALLWLIADIATELFLFLHTLGMFCWPQFEHFMIEIFVSPLCLELGYMFLLLFIVQVSTCCARSWSGCWTSACAPDIFHHWKIAASCIFNILMQGSLPATKCEAVAASLTAVAIHCLCWVESWGTVMLRGLQESCVGRNPHSRGAQGRWPRVTRAERGGSRQWAAPAPHWCVTPRSPGRERGPAEPKSVFGSSPKSRNTFRVVIAWAMKCLPTLFRVGRGLVLCNMTEKYSYVSCGKLNSASASDKTQSLMKCSK